MKIHETIGNDGANVSSRLERDDGALVFVDIDGTSTSLPDGALDAVMNRFGAPLDHSVDLVPVDALDLGDGRTLRHVRHLARFDVIAKDFLVLESSSREPLCALATTVAGAIDHLARAARAAATRDG